MPPPIAPRPTNPTSTRRNLYARGKSSSMRDEIDAFLGERVERVIRSHHRRRLKRIGWEHALDAHERPMHCHHEKLVIVDGELAFVGGIDLTTLQGDRFDRSDHPARGAHGWHDATALLRGPAVADVADHFALRWREVTGETIPATAPPPGAGGR